MNWCIEKMDYKQILAIQRANEERIKKICCHLNHESGIYLFYRNNEEGEFCVYVGQAKDLLQRTAQHLTGYKKKNPTHIDKSLFAHKLYSENNKDGWKVSVLKFAPQNELDQLEKDYIKEYQSLNCKVYNITGGGQLDKAGDINERMKLKLKTYAHGKKYAYEKVRQEIAHLFDKYLDFTIKGKETATKLKAKSKFEKFIKGDSDDAI